MTFISAFFRPAFFLFLFHLIFIRLDSTNSQADSPNVYCRDLGTAAETYDVVIIGAGIAGLAAARTLYHNYSITSLTIIEARDRVGGRINTIFEGDSVIEIGAQFIHGTNGNPVYELAAWNDLYVPDEDIDAVDDEFYTEKGVELDDAFVDECDTMVYDILDAVNMGLNFSVSYGNQFKQEFEKIVPTTDRNYQFKKGYMDWEIRELSSTLGDELENRNLGDELDYDAYEGPDLQLKSGYYKVIELLQQGLPQSLVEGSTKVVKVYWDVQCPAANPASAYNGMGLVRVADGRLIAGKHIISTLPLGVLKTNDVTFVPNLRTSMSLRAKRKASSISRLGFACLNKIYFKWSERWWPTTTDAINVVWTNENVAEDGISIQADLYRTEEEKLWYRKVSGFNSFYSQPTMLQAWAYGKWARLIERLPETEIQSVLMQALRAGAGPTYDNEIPEPIKVFTTRWCSDEFAKGTYSYIDMNSNAGDFNTLAEPLPSDDAPVLLFAGEATSRDQWSTVPAGYNSGVREADRIARHMQKLT